MLEFSGITAALLEMMSSSWFKFSIPCFITKLSGQMESSAGIILDYLDVSEYLYVLKWVYILNKFVAV